MKEESPQPSLPFKLIEALPLSNLTLQEQLYQTVCAAIKLDLFSFLQTPKTSAELSAEINTNPRPTFYFLKLLVHLGCLDETGGRFKATSMANTYLRSESYLYLGHDFSISAGDAIASQLLAVLNANTETIRPEPDWNQERLRQIGVYSLMGPLPGTLAACGLEGANHLLDLGGGHGFYSIAFAQKYPGLKITLFDLPQIAVLAEKFVQQFSLQQQIKLKGGNFLTDDIGSNYDAVLCSNILHSSKRDVLLPKIYTALNPGGKIIVTNRIANAPDTLENAAANLMWQIRGGGELFGFAEWHSFLSAHGFKDITLAGISGIFATIVARTEKNDERK